MTQILIGCARCSTDKQDLAAQKGILASLGIAADRIYTDHGFTGTNRARPEVLIRRLQPCGRVTR